MRRPLRKVGAFTRLQMRHNDQSMAMFISRCDERAFDMPRAGRQNLSTFKLVAPILADQAKILRIVRVPDAEHLSFLDLKGDEQNLLAPAVTKDEANRIDMAFKQSPKRQAARPHLSQHLA